MEHQFFGTEFDTAWKEWKAKQNGQGVIYYVNDTMQVTSWNHPYFSKVLDELDIKYGRMKYAVYRTSFKLRDLQSHIGLKWIHLAAIMKVFTDCPAEDDKYLSYSEALALIQHSLHFSDKLGHSEEDIRSAANLILNLMMSLYDVNRCGKIGKRSIRNALATMCCASLNEKYRYFFTLVRDENQNVCREKLISLLDDLMQFPYVVNEGESFGRNVIATVDSCFKVAGDFHSGKISHKSFHLWLMLEPQTLTWLPTFHRILATETVQHNVRCSVCRAVQITGLRYRCLQCLRYAMCQECFLHGLTSLRHNLRHPVREYCLPASVKDNTKALLAILKNKLRINRTRRTQTGYLPVDTVTEHSVSNNWLSGNIQTNSSSCNSNSMDSGLAIGSEDVGSSGHDSHSVNEEHEVRTQKKPLGILGKPCSSSSPSIGSYDKDFTLLSRRDIEMQQQQMVLAIEQLQRENRILKSKLDTIYKYCDAEVTDEQDVTEECETERTLMACSRDHLKKIYDVPISPIVDNIAHVPTQRLEENSSSNIGEQQVYIHDVIGTFTPVGSTPLNKPSLHLSHTQNSEQSEKCLDFMKYNESSTPNGLRYQSVTSLSFESMKDELFHEKLETGLSRTSVTESTLPDLLMYRLSDMSLDVQDTVAQSKVSDADLSESENSLGSQTAQSTDNLTPENCSVIISSHTSELNSSRISTTLSLKKRSQNRQPCLVFSSSSLKSRSECASSSDLAKYSENIDNDAVSDCQNPFAEKSCPQANENDSCMELSEIFHHGQTMLHSTEPTPVHKTAQRWKTVEPVHMSTPVNDTAQFLLRKQPQSNPLTFSDAEYNKENITVTSGKRKFNHSQSGYNTDLTPLSAISWHKKGILRSVNSLPFNHSLDSYNLSDNGGDTRNLSTFFKKAEQIGNKISEVTSETMVTHERDELEKLIMNFEKECKFDDNAHSGMWGSSRKIDDENMLAAVQNIEDAMSNFVQATSVSA